MRKDQTQFPKDSRFETWLCTIKFWRDFQFQKKLLPHEHFHVFQSREIGLQLIAFNFNHTIKQKRNAQANKSRSAKAQQI